MAWRGCCWPRQSFDWHSIAVLATWFMTLLIQRATHRDKQALHAKLDELLHAQSEASNRLTLIDKEDPEDIEKHLRLARGRDRKDEDAAVSPPGDNGAGALIWNGVPSERSKISAAGTYNWKLIDRANRAFVFGSS